MSTGEDLQLAVVGAGYVGLVTAACLAQAGHTVRCIDRDRARVADLSQGVVPFREPGLDQAMTTGLASGRLSFSDDLAASHAAAAVLIAVGTLGSDGEWSSEQLEAAVQSVAADPLAPRTIVIRSTLVPGTMARLERQARAIDPHIELAYNPEFTREGSAVRDFTTPDRTVVGLTRPAELSRAAEVLARTYAPLNAPLVMTDAASAELVKIGANAFLALKVGYANEMARIAAAADADISAVLATIGLDHRIGRDFLTPGPGFGGSCLPSQARALPRAALAQGVDVPILAAIDASNRAQANWVVQELERAVGDLSDVPVALLGLTFKAGTDDVRESSSVALAVELARRGARLVVHDPLALGAGLVTLRRAGVDARGAQDVHAALTGVAAIIVATEWPLYASIDWRAARMLMAGDVVIDARGVIDRAAAADAGLRLVVHGRAVAAAQPQTQSE
ncbi:MAG: nucleotide sugar dehydrogenase [Chloroflexota bacterium]